MTVTNPIDIQIRHPDKLFIDGQWTAPSKSVPIPVIDATTEAVVISVANAGKDDVHRAVAAARRAFDNGSWSTLPPAERAVYLRAIAGEIDKRSDEIGRLWTAEVGIVHWLSSHLAATIGDVFRYYAGLADTFPFEEEHKPTAGGEFGLIVREPAGVVGAIIPWNSPILLVAYKVAPALLAGCTVILKASPEAPTAAYIFAEAAEAAGLPAGVVNILTADRDVSEELVRHPDVDKVTFTGSTAAGRRIASICGERIARVTLELGGKSPALILDDCDIGTAAQSLSQYARLMTGQACSSLTRIIVTRKRHDMLVEALEQSFGSLTLGNPFDPATEMGPLASIDQRNRVERYFDVARHDGARLVTGGGRPRGIERGYFVEPTLYADVDNDMVIAREEIFGPVLCVIPAQDEEDVIAIANDTIFGLNASIFTDDKERAYAVARRIRSGTVGQNAFRTDFGIAFGGFKQSGIGREGGVEGLLPFLETKTVILDGRPASHA